MAAAAGPGAADAAAAARGRRGRHGLAAWCGAGEPLSHSVTSHLHNPPASGTVTASRPPQGLDDHSRPGPAGRRAAGPAGSAGP